MRGRVPLIGALLLAIIGSVRAEVRWGDVLRQKPDWYASGEAHALADTILLYQSPEGGWPKNRDMTQPPSAAQDAKDTRAPTIDNGATTTQLRLLARVHAAQPASRWSAAIGRGLDYLLAAQYENGGWPQFYPLVPGYYTHITFNDDAMVNVLAILRDVALDRAPFTGIDAARRARAAAAVEKGIACILRCQIVINGVKTAWCAQHDEHTFAPAPARKYEHASLSGFESVGIVRFLMEEESPSPEVIAAVHAAVAWFEQAKLTGFREDHPPNPALPHGFDRVLVADPGAPPLWARFYEIGTNRPIYSGRDAIIRYNLAEVEPERRGGYRWHIQDPQRLLEKEYPAWAKKWPAVAPQPDTGPAVASAKADVIVAADGSGQYTSVQEAISKAPMRTGRDDPRWIILVKPGLYRERIHVQRERGNILVRGEDAEKTIITYDLHANLPGPDGKIIGTFRTPTLWIDGDGMIWENITIANSAGEPGPRPGAPAVAQAVALHVDGDRVTFRGCRFLGWQDTILVNRGRHYFVDCYIEGSVDFIFGGATAYFERCHIHCLKDGYITAASTPDGAPHGLVFADCTITGAEDVRTYLGRPWRDFAKTVFIRTEMSGVVRPEGWHNWDKSRAERTALYGEFASFGPGAGGPRVAWAKKFQSGAAALFTPAIVLAGTDGWNPDPRPTLHLVGDSTLADKPDLGYPERGWGQLLRERIGPSLRLVNHAVNGRSTKSFRDLGHWQNLLDQLHAGDWVVIQFGHNDSKQEDPTRYADAATDYPANLRGYIAEIRAHGAHPILATPVVRRNWSDTGELLDSHGAYLAAARSVAGQEKVPLLEMEGATRALLTRLGPEASKKLFMIYAAGEHLAIPEGKTDNTHFNEEGARMVADLAVQEMKRINLPLADSLRSSSDALSARQSGSGR